MRTHKLLTLAAILLAISSATSAHAAEIAPGWDLFQTLSGTSFNGVPFTGVPIGAFNFGGTIGTKPVGNSDTIIQRLASASVPIPPGDTIIPTQMLALELVSTTPTNFGLGTGFYYITLQSTRGGPATVGNMNIHFNDNNGGTFSSFFDVFFDIRLGDLNGPIALSSDLQLTGQDSWTRTPSAGAITIPGVNSLLNGTNTEKDFWPGVPFTESHPTGAQHTVTNATVPLPAAVWPGAALLALLGGTRIVRRKRDS